MLLRFDFLRMSPSARPMFSLNLIFLMIANCRFQVRTTLFVERKHVLVMVFAYIEVTSIAVPEVYQ